MASLTASLIQSQGLYPKDQVSLLFDDLQDPIRLNFRSNCTRSESQGLVTPRSLLPLIRPSREVID